MDTAHPSHGVVGRQIDSGSVTVGNESFRSKLVFSLIDITEQDGSTDVTVTIDNIPEAGGGFLAEVDVQVVVGGSTQERSGVQAYPSLSGGPATTTITFSFDTTGEVGARMSPVSTDIEVLLGSLRPGSGGGIGLIPVVLAGGAIVWIATR